MARATSQQPLPRFLQLADYWLVAHALAHEYVVVTHEVPAQTIRKIKIPTACIGLNIRCMSPYQMLRQEKSPVRARFNQIGLPADGRRGYPGRPAPSFWGSL